jgi:hypothetical protein
MHTMLCIAATLLCCVQCDWAIISYTNNSTETLLPITKQAEAQGVKVVLLRDGNLPLKAAKVLFWPMFKNVAAKYEYLWLLDEDMSFVGFDFDGFRTALALGFSAGKPMLAQPVLWRRDANDPSKYLLTTSIAIQVLYWCASTTPCSGNTIAYSLHSMYNQC